MSHKRREGIIRRDPACFMAARELAYVQRILNVSLFLLIGVEVSFIAEDLLVLLEKEWPACSRRRYPRGVLDSCKDWKSSPSWV
jgi:hypothetical protein